MENGKAVRFEDYPAEEQRRYVIAQLTAEARRTGILKLDAVDMVADFLIENGWHTKNVKKAATALRALGNPVPPDEKEAFGIGRRAKLGRAFVDALTEAGKSNVTAAAEAIAYWSWHGIHFFSSLHAADQRGMKARMMVDDRFSCECVKPFVKVVLPPHKTPLFPLDQCTNWRCTCSVDSYQRDIMGPPARKPNMRKLGVPAWQKSKEARGVIDPQKDLKMPVDRGKIVFTLIGTAFWIWVLYVWVF